MAFSPYDPQGHRQVTLPNGTVVTVPDNIPNQIPPNVGNTPIPGYGGQTPNSIISNTKGLVSDLKQAPGQVVDYFKNDLGQEWDHVKNTMIPVAAIGGATGLGAMLASWAGGGSSGD